MEKMTPEEQERAVSDVRQLLGSRGWQVAMQFINQWVNGATQSLMSASGEREAELWKRGGVDALTTLVGFLEQKAQAQATGKPERTSHNPLTNHRAFERM